MIKVIYLCWVDSEDHKKPGKATLYVSCHDSIETYCYPVDPKDIELDKVTVQAAGRDYEYITEDMSKEKEEQVKKMLRDKMLADLLYMSSELMGNNIEYVELMED